MASQGSVKNFNADKGFGFIIGSDGSDIFVHISACIDDMVPLPGDIMQFDVEPSKAKPGQMTATNVSGGSGVPGRSSDGNVGIQTGPPSGTRQSQCKSYNSEKGFGFILGTGGTDDVFLHIKAMVDGSTPQQGDWLTYDAKPSTSKPGQMQATNVTGGTGVAADSKRDAGKGGDGYGASMGDSWGAPMGGKGSPYGGGKASAWGGGDPWSVGGGMAFGAASAW